MTGEHATVGVRPHGKAPGDGRARRPANFGMQMPSRKRADCESERENVHRPVAPSFSEKRGVFCCEGTVDKRVTFNQLKGGIIMKDRHSLVMLGSAVLLIVVAAFSRLLPHPANFTPLGAIALFGGVYLDKRYAVAIPLVAMLASDYFLGFYQGMYWVYGSFLLVCAVGLWLRSHKSVLVVLGGTLASSVIFFVVTNFGVWLPPGTMYAASWSGLVECYVAAIPFFRNSVAGDLIFVALLFGAYEGILAYARKMGRQPIVS